jgi:hypothetical protein
MGVSFLLRVNSYDMRKHHSIFIYSSKNVLIVVICHIFLTFNGSHPQICFGSVPVPNQLHKLIRVHKKLGSEPLAKYTHSAHSYATLTLPTLLPFPLVWLASCVSISPLSVSYGIL